MRPVRMVLLKRKYCTFPREKAKAEGDLLLGLKLKIPDGVNIEVNVCDKVKYFPCLC